MPNAENDVERLEEKAIANIQSCSNLKDLEEISHRYIGKKGELTLLLRSLGNLEEKERKELGQKANKTREKFEHEFAKKKQELIAHEFAEREQEEWIDSTAPGTKVCIGHLHPLTQIQREAKEIFQAMGFAVADGPEIESEWYNFDALNIPASHPARDMWDTFWLKEPQNPEQNPLAGGASAKKKEQKFLLRTHTSPVQIRYMEKVKPPLRVIAPGRIFRYEATDARHEINFYQLEGLMIGKDVSAAHLKGIIQEFFKLFFRKETVVRLRPSYFPFVEPGFEVDMRCVFCEGKGFTANKTAEKKDCSSCGHGGWIEIMGAGMVHPNVLRAVKCDPKEWQGFAFGIGLDRLAMMKYKINDIRLLYSGDLRFLKQF